MKEITGLKIGDIKCTEVLWKVDILAGKSLFKRLLWAFNPVKYKYLSEIHEERRISKVVEVNPGVYNVHVSDDKVDMTSCNEIKVP